MEVRMATAKTKLISAPSPAATLTRATLRAARQLGMTNKALANVIGVSEATVSRMRTGGYTLQSGQKSFELAILFVRLYRSLDAIIGGDEAVARAWLKNRNTALDGEPLTLIQTVPGLMNAIHYLDARRAIV
jgi:transcriptional regulator with XRE-family HTH domain